MGKKGKPRERDKTDSLKLIEKKKGKSTKKVDYPCIGMNPDKPRL